MSVGDRAPAVSVVIPSYNRMEWLPDAVASVLDQTYRDLELIVVDDGSTDGTARWLAAIEDHRVRSIRLPHSGNVARVRNAGAGQAAGRFLCFLDSDDLWLPRKLEVQMADARPGVWSYTRYEHIDERGACTPPRAGEWRPLAGRITVPVIRMEASVSIITVLIPRDLFEASGGFDERPQIREDYEFLSRLAARGDAVAVSECLALVREHPSRTTHALRGAEPFLINADTCQALLESLDQEDARNAARQQHARHLTEAAAAYLRAGAIGAAAGCLLRAARSGASARQCASAVWRGLGPERNRFRRLLGR